MGQTMSSAKAYWLKGARVRIIVNATHRLVVERSFLLLLLH